MWPNKIGAKLDFWRIFENFGFAVLVLKLPTYGTFFEISVSTPFAFSPRVAMSVGVLEPHLISLY